MARVGVIDEDRAGLEVLNSNLRKTQELTVIMSKLLGGFDERLQKMEGTMKPIHRTTKRLKIVDRSMFTFSNYTRMSLMNKMSMLPSLRYNEPKNFGRFLERKNQSSRQGMSLLNPCEAQLLIQAVHRRICLHF